VAPSQVPSLRASVPSLRVIVVGAGLAGLSTACHLAGRGHRVTVVERAESPGGLAGQWRSAGYRIDTGPTVLTMPGLVSATLAAAGGVGREAGQALLDLRSLDPAYRACWPDGSVIRVRRGREAMTEEIRSTCGSRDAAAFGRFCDWLTRLYEVEEPGFIARNYDGPLDLVRPPGPAVALARMGAFRQMSSVVDSRFADHRLRQLFSFQSLYAGLAPFQALAIYSIITYMDTVAGVWAPVGGVHAVARALAAAAGAAGVELRYGMAAAQVMRRLGRSGPVTGVRLADGTRLGADAVVCTPDVFSAYTQLVPGASVPRPAAEGRYSPSAALWLAGTRGAPPAGAAHHNVHFGSQWRGSFHALVDAGTRQPDPSVLVSLPALTDPTAAPAGGQVVYALEPVPNLDGRVDWTTERDRCRQELRGRLAGWGYPVGDVVTDRFVDPLDWEAMGLTRGTPFSLAHTFTQSGPWRVPNRDRRVPGLVLAGAGTVPGVSVPMVLTSGRLAADRVDELALGR